ncbi:MAG TPA: TIGR03435 family protein [Terracidiphilus sp.]
MIILRKYCSPLLVSVLSILMAQARAQCPTNQPPVGAPAKFDVASIRPSADRSSQSGGWMGTRINGDTFEARSMSLKALVWFAYANRGSQRDTVSGGGGWIDSRDWDIVAKVDDPSLAELSDTERSNSIRPLVQALLDERFHMRLHTEIRPTPVYVLEQAKGGAKVKEVSAPPAVEGDWIEALKRYSEENPAKPFPGAIRCDDRCTASATSMSNALGQIQGSSHADRMVIDETGLKGYYDFSFRNPSQDDDDAMGEIEEDLGMKFEARKVDLTTYVIDSAQLPTPN